MTKLHPHRFRHTAGTIVREQLGDPRLTAEFLGHYGLGSVAGYTEVSHGGTRRPPTRSSSGGF